MHLPFLDQNFFREFDAMDSQKDDMSRSLGFQSNLRSFMRGTFPALNVGGTDDIIEVVIVAPGVNPADFQVTIDKSILSVSGDRKSTMGDRDGVVIYSQERPAGKFSRIIELPQEADPNRVEAHYTDGFLRILVHKNESSKPRLIQIQ